MKPLLAAPFALGAALCLFQPLFAAPSRNFVQALIPQGWVALHEGVARGDLNRDGRSDLALAVGRATEEKLVEVGGDSRRRLLVFFRQSNGTLKQVFANETAILGRNQGGAMGDPFQSLRIQRGSLVIEHWGGSRETWEYTHRFRFQNGRWRLIGLRNAERDRLTGNTSQRETNLLTGKVEYSAGDLNKTTANRRFWELRAVPAGKVAPPLKLASAATLRANLEGSTLVVKAQLTDPKASFRLRDGKGRLVKPISLSKKGNLQTAHYSWKALNPRESYGDTIGAAGQHPDYIADATLEVAYGRQIRRSSRGNYPAQIRYTRQAEVMLPPLKESS